jgi:hypothetical protein
MGTFTIVPAWIIQDVLVLGITVAKALFIVKREEQPGPVLREIVCFVLRYAAVYENFATLMGWHGCGRSIVMVVNVSPLRAGARQHAPGAEASGRSRVSAS